MCVTLIGSAKELTVKKLKNVGFRVDDELYEQIRTAAYKNHTSMGGFVRRTIRDLLNTPEEQAEQEQAAHVRQAIQDLQDAGVQSPDSEEK